MSLRSPRSIVRALAAAGLAAQLLSAGCGARSAPPSAPASSSVAVSRAAELERAIAAQDLASLDLLARNGVVGTGAGLDPAGRARVLVLVESEAVDVPATIGGVPVEEVAVGAVQPWALDQRYRPVAIGVSAGNANECLPGTIGCVLERGNRRFLLSANHVFARQNQGAIGEAIVQPSLPDLDPACGPAPPSAVVATLADFQTIVYDGRTPNTMDAAIAEVTVPPSALSCATPAGFYGLPGGGVATAVDGLAIMKLGRTTELTRGQVKAVNVKVKVTFPAGTALFTNQVLTSPGFGGFGDSGSLVVTDDAARGAVGIVIGGGNNGAAIVSPIGPILARFNARICTR